MRARNFFLKSWTYNAREMHRPAEQLICEGPSKKSRMWHNVGLLVTKPAGVARRTNRKPDTGGEAPLLLDLH